MSTENNTDGTGAVPPTFTPPPAAPSTPLPAPAYLPAPAPAGHSGPSAPFTAVPAPQPPKPPRSRLTLAALIVGIVAIVLAIIPGPSFVAFLPAIAAVALGIIGLVSKKPGRGGALAGIILGVIALPLAIIVSTSTIMAGVGTATGEKPASTPAATAPAEKPVAETAPPEETPEPVEVPADIVYSGNGDMVLPIELVDGAGQVAIATISHVGDRNFAIWSLDSAMAQQELMVNTIGNYQGTVLFNNGRGDDVTSLEITADGAWTVTVRSLLAARWFDGATTSGTGDDVVLYGGAAGPAAITHDGSRNFAIWTYGKASDLVVNEIGAYSGTTRWAAGPTVVVVSADGNWTIAVG